MTIFWRQEESSGGEPEEATGQGVASDSAEGTGAATAASPTSDDFRISKQEWEEVRGALGYIAQQVMAGQTPTDEEGEEVDLNDPEAMARLVQQYVDQRVSEVHEAVSPAVRAEGERRLHQLFDDFSKDPNIGDFDRGVAQKLAESSFQPGLDPVQVAKMAATEAAAIRKREREAGREEFKKSLRGPGQDDLGGSGSAERQRPKFQSYDEVVEFYAGQEEV